MYLHFLMFTLSLLNLQDITLPQPTKEQIDLVKKLGEEEFDIREQAQNDLEKLEIKALLAVERYGLKNHDLEIRRRSKRIVDKFYFDVVSSKDRIPLCTGLFKLKEVELDKKRKYKIPSGTARKYYEAVGGNFLNSWEAGGNDHEYHTYLATRLIIRDMRRSGFSKEDIVKVLDAMEKNEYNYSWYELQYDEENVQHKSYYYKKR